MSRLVGSIALAASLLLGATATAEAVSPKQAIRIMQKAGYSGIGGVSRARGNYVAAAIAPGGKRVRVSVDAGTGAIVRVAAFPRGAGSITPQTRRRVPYVPPRIEARTPDANFDYYHAPRAPRAVGVTNYPWRADRSGPAAAWCRYRANAPGC
jgi:hypothetical protein